MPVVEGCKHSLEITVPAAEVEAETGRAIEKVRGRVRLPGFRPGKVPPALIRKQFAADIRQQVLETLIPKYLDQKFKAEDLKVVGRPDITEVEFKDGEPLRFKAEFEIYPDFELKEYKNLSVPYHDPEITEEDIDRRIEELRRQKADYVNIDPRPLEDGDYAVVSLLSVAGVEGEPIRQDEMMVQIGGEETLEAFSENLRGMSPGEEKEFEVSYPPEFATPRLAGKTVRFRAQVKGLRRQELPEVNDEFAEDLGDYRNLGELREAIRKSMFAQRQHEAQELARDNLLDQLVDLHEFPVPEAFIDQQIKTRVAQGLRAQGLDPKEVPLDWKEIKAAQRDRALREVKGSMLLSRVAQREAISATMDDVDREVERIARQQREPFAAVKLRLEKEGALGRIASRIETDKTLNFLFEHARKTAD